MKPKMVNPLNVDVVEKPLTDVLQEFIQMARNDEIQAVMIEELERTAGYDEESDTYVSIEDLIMLQISKNAKYEGMIRGTTKFSQWLSENESILSESEYQRHYMQYQYYQSILNEYENEPVNYARVLQLTQGLQQYGPLPDEIMKSQYPDMDEEHMGLNMHWEFDGPDMPLGT